MAFHLRTLTPDIHLYLGDAMEVMAHLKAENPDGLADFICADPPYGISYKGAGNRAVRNDEEVHLEWVPPMVDLMKPNTAMLLFSRTGVGWKWWNAMRRAGITMPIGRFEMTFWDKVYPSPADLFNLLAEVMMVGAKGLVPTRTWEDRCRFFPSNPGALVDFNSDEEFWRVPVARNKRNRRHPTAKPPKLMERALLNYSDEGDLVLDPFMGGAPVGVAAVRLNRRYIGIELERPNFNLAVENIQRELARQRIFRQARELVATAAARHVGDESSPTM